MAGDKVELTRANVALKQLEVGRFWILSNNRRTGLGIVKENLKQIKKHVYLGRAVVIRLEMPCRGNPEET